MIVDGRKIAQAILNRLKRRPKSKKTLAAILVGRNPASVSFLKQKAKTALALGIKFDVVNLSATVKEKEIKDAILELNQDRKIGGIILQLPLPKKFKREEIIDLIDDKKDVDALGRKPLVLSPAVGVLEEILKWSEIDLKDSQAVVIGRGILVGEPIAEWLKNRVKKLTVFHSQFFDKKILKQADLVISGVGKPAFIKASVIKRGAVLIDYGYSYKNGKVQGDFDFKSCGKKARYLTPTPGGTGPILVAKLFENFFKLVQVV